MRIDQDVSDYSEEELQTLSIDMIADYAALRGVSIDTITIEILP